MNKYRVAVVGVGMVGRKMVEVLLERNFPFASLAVLATRERTEQIAGRSFAVQVASAEALAGIELAFFAGTEGEKGAGAQLAWKAVAGGTVVIDNGGDFRMDRRVPLVVPEVNPGALDRHCGLIANPNCSTIQLVVALAPLHRALRLRRIIVSTYQAVSGTGTKAVAELEAQVRSYCAGEPVRSEVYPRPIAFNVLPQIGSLAPRFPGYFTEEVKMILETRKILSAPRLRVSATCVRVPVFNAHSESVTVQFERSADVELVRRILGSAPGVRIVDEPADGIYPLPVDVSGKDDVFVGRIRRNTCLPRAFDFWLVGDNIRKGAALNAVQIAEELIRRNRLTSAKAKRRSSRPVS